MTIHFSDMEGTVCLWRWRWFLPYWWCLCISLFMGNQPTDNSKEYILSPFSIHKKLSNWSQVSESQRSSNITSQGSDSFVNKGISVKMYFFSKLRLSTQTLMESCVLSKFNFCWLYVIQYIVILMSNLVPLHAFSTMISSLERASMRFQIQLGSASSSAYVCFQHQSFVQIHQKHYQCWPSVPPFSSCSMHYSITTCKIKWQKPLGAG